MYFINEPSSQCGSVFIVRFRKVCAMVTFKNLFVFGGAGSSLRRAEYLQSWQAGDTLVSVWRLRIVVASFVVWHRLPAARGLQEWQCMGLSGSKACGVFPDQALNLCPLHWQLDS